MSFTASLTKVVSQNSNGLLSLHKSWTRVELDLVASILNGFAFHSSSFDHDKGTPLLRIRDVLKTTTETRYNGKYDAQYVVRPGELVVGMDGDFNCALWKGPPALLNQRVCKIIPDERFYSRKFLTFVLPGYLSTINVHTSAITVKHLSSRTVAEIPLPLPPVKEQHRIVGEIEKQFTRLDAAIASLKRIQANLKRYRASVLKAACEGCLVPTEAELARKEGRDYEPAAKLRERILKERRAKWEADELAKMRAKGKEPKNDSWKEKYKEPKPPIRLDKSSLPEGWTPARWEQIGFSQNGRAFPSREYQNEGIKLLRPGNLSEDGSVIWNQGNTRHLPEKWAKEHPDFIVGPRELVMNLTAQSLADEFLGRVCLTGPSDKCLLNQRIARLKPVEVNPFYLLYMFKSEAFRKFVNGLNTGSLIQHMFTSQLAGFELPLPPSPEQQRIAAEAERHLSIIHHLENAVDESLRRVDTLRQSILKRAFEGKLAPQDPNDEPAAVLLERIRAEREKAEAMANTPTPRRGRHKRTKPAMAPESSVPTEPTKARQMALPLGASQSDPKEYTREDWRRCLLESLSREITDRDEAIRVAAEWAAQNMGLRFSQLHADGAIMTGLKSALNSAIRRGEIERLDAQTIRLAGKGKL